MSVLGIGGMSKIINNYAATPPKSNALNWNEIPHKGMERPTEAEFNVIIDNLAKALAEAAYNKKDSEYNNLRAMAEQARAQYVSAVSPDRKALVKEAQHLIHGASPANRTKGTEFLTLIDIMNLKDGIVVSRPDGLVNVKLPSGTEITFNNPNSSTSHFDIKSGGVTVMSWFEGSWAYNLTSQERVLHDNFLNRINSAERRYYQQYIDSGISGDSKGQEADPAIPANGKLDFSV